MRQQSTTNGESELMCRPPTGPRTPSLERVSALLELVGNPHRELCVVHITGTNGKSSTARMIDELLQSCGYSTGRFTSPHLISVRERIVTNGQAISSRDFEKIYDDLRPHIDQVDGLFDKKLSFFEIITAVSFVYFAARDVDVSIIEVGIGGRWDATNVVDAQLAVFTPISLDHMEILGPTEVVIAQEKSGIIKRGTDSISAPQLGPVAEILESRTRSMNGVFTQSHDVIEMMSRTQHPTYQRLHLTSKNGSYPDVTLSAGGRYQADNARVALATVEAFLSTAGRTISPDEVRTGFARVAAPGRMELVSRSPMTFADASHNPAGIRVSLAALREMCPNAVVIVVLAIASDKDVDGVLAELTDVTHVVASENDSPRCMPADRLTRSATRILTSSHVHVDKDFAGALTTAKRLAVAAGGVMLVTGSVVTAGLAKAILAGDTENPGVDEKQLPSEAPSREGAR